MNSEHNYIISIDYLQFSVRGIVEPNRYIQYIDQEHSSRQFEKIAKIKMFNKEIGLIQYKPFSKIIESDISLIKINNKLLYQSSLQQIIYKFLEYSKLKYNKLSRIDICADFSTFLNNYNPHKLIKQFLLNKLKKIGTRKFMTVGEQKVEHEFNYIRFGNIREMWRDNKLTGTEIWRLEFSISGANFHILEKQTGEIRRLELSKILNYNFQYELFQILQSQYFEFRIYEKNVNTSRLKKLKLFENYIIKQNKKLQKFCEKGESSRAEKNTITNLIKQLEKNENKTEQTRICQTIHYITDYHLLYRHTQKKLSEIITNLDKIQTYEDVQEITDTYYDDEPAEMPF